MEWIRHWWRKAGCRFRTRVWSESRRRRRYWQPVTCPLIANPMQGVKANNFCLQKWKLVCRSSKAWNETINFGEIGVCCRLQFKLMLIFDSPVQSSVQAKFRLKILCCILLHKSEKYYFEYVMDGTNMVALWKIEICSRKHVWPTTKRLLALRHFQTTQNKSFCRDDFPFSRLGWQQITVVRSFVSKNFLHYPIVWSP